MDSSVRGSRKTKKCQRSSHRRSQQPTAVPRIEAPRETTTMSSAPVIGVSLAVPSTEALQEADAKSSAPVTTTAFTELSPEIPRQVSTVFSAPVTATISTVLSPEAPQEGGTKSSAPATAPAPVVLSSPLDHILIFGHGWFQRLALLCTTLAFFTTVLHAGAINILAHPVDHWCKAPAEYAHIAAEVWRNTSLPIDADGITPSQCFRYEPPVPSERGHSFENRSTIACDAGWNFGVDPASGNEINSIVKEWSLVCGRRWMLAALIAAYMFGGVVTAPLAGIAADKIGRRPLLFLGLFWIAFAGISLVFARTVLTFAVLRAFLSAGAVSVLVSSVVVLFEVTDTKHRALFCSLAVSVGSLTANLYSTLVYRLVFDWKVVQITYMVPTCTLILAVYLMEESPCWLLGIGDLKRAEKVLSWAARVNDADVDTFKQRLSELMFEQRRHQQDTCSSDIASQSQDMYVPILLRNQTLRQQSLVFFACWFVLCAVYFKLVTGQVMSSNSVASIAIAILKLPSVPVNVFIITFAGRRRTLANSLFAMAVVTGSLAMGHTFRASGHILGVAVVIWVLIFDLCVLTLFIMPAELYPTVVRGAGLSFCYACGRVGACVAPFLNEVRAPYLKGVLYTVAAALLLIFGLMALGLPETTEVQPANTMREFAAKWQLKSPLRIARGGGKRKRYKSGETTHRD